MEFESEILPSLSDELDTFLFEPELPPFNKSEQSLGFWERTPQAKRLLHSELAPVPTTLQVERNPATGEITGFKEVVKVGAGCTAKNSSSLRRAPGPPIESTKGNSTNFPFWPGGLEEPLEEVVGAKAVDELLAELEDSSLRLSCPPRFEKGIDFSSQGQAPTKNGASNAQNNLINLAQALNEQVETGLELWTDEPLIESTSDSKTTSSSIKSFQEAEEYEIEEPNPSKVVAISDGAAPKPPGTREWAEMVDVTNPMLDFHHKVPQMAFTWPFELDTFQKQAVFRLENNESVFVAAHTSAGKTVVAEYAIALSQKHMTRTIYTSPIKALSNQKFRDFKDTFEDVGLVTGDIQINPTATCLIMTTEILRSMLYNGSDIIRDLEYVIFDEVHYINDRERGVVWEEVLILLPDHVNIIMLSATVPNTLDFADWVGRTKKKKIYVISTLKRPVPLEHFLYTGSNAKSRDELFLLQDASGQFLQTGYNKAVTAKKNRESKGKQQYGAKGVKDRVTLQQEKNIWLTLIDHLDRHDKLPVVAFTLSRNRCDQNADQLTSLDLTTAMEKSDIHHFIQKCVQRLKGSDRKLPQVLKMIDLLKRGIGIHHSGILPILKEVVEMLFQRGWVKLLFATETFAMGVNMPARTVVFDNIKKHDGTQMRTLLPAEYIQMAGRAGRRGLDTTGTVIILCKNEVFDMAELHGMMQGKPQKLESQFRLTYSMILNLLRVEKLRVEDMMKRSFKEVDSQKKANALKERLSQATIELKTLPVLDGPVFDHLDMLFSQLQHYLNLRERYWTLLLSHPTAVKLLTPGRFLLIEQSNGGVKVGMLLHIDNKSREKVYSVLVLDSEDNAGLEMDPKMTPFMALCAVVEFENVGSLNHQVQRVADQKIVEILAVSAKADGDKIMADIKKREIPRFRNDPPGQTTNAALQELVKISESAAQGSVEMVSFVRDFKVFDIDLQTVLRDMENVKGLISDLRANQIPDFMHQFQKIFQRKTLEQEIQDLEYLCSEESLEHLPEYHQHVEVLQQLGYIDTNKTVRLKGRVACEMGSQELIITELVLDNVLTDLPPEEIAALLSCMVFQQKRCSAPELNQRLEEGVKKIKNCAAMIGQCQKDCGMTMPVLDYVEQFNFGLVEVVYEWAKGMPFAEITQLTDVQEGVIVRTIQRLDETIRDVKDAARVIGDSMLYQKMDTTSTQIKRDIVFAASLYTQ